MISAVASEVDEIERDSKKFNYFDGFNRHFITRAFWKANVFKSAANSSENPT